MVQHVFMMQEQVTFLLQEHSMQQLLQYQMVRVVFHLQIQEEQIFGQEGIQ